MTLENKYWHIEPRDNGQDDIDEMVEEAELEPDPMTLAKAKKEEELLDLYDRSTS